MRARFALFLTLAWLAAPAALRAQDSFKLLRVFDPAGTRTVSLACVHADFCEIEVDTSGVRQLKQIERRVGLKWLAAIAPASHRRPAGESHLLFSWEVSRNGRRTGDEISVEESFRPMTTRRRRQVEAVVGLEQRLLSAVE